MLKILFIITVVGTIGICVLMMVANVINKKFSEQSATTKYENIERCPKCKSHLISNQLDTCPFCREPLFKSCLADNLSQEIEGDDIKHLNKEYGRLLIVRTIAIISLMISLYYIAYISENEVDYYWIHIVIKTIFLLIMSACFLSAYHNAKILLRGNHAIAIVKDLKIVEGTYKGRKYKYYNLIISYEEENCKETMTKIKQNISCVNNINVGDKYEIIYLKERRKNRVIFLDYKHNIISDYIVVIASIIIIVLWIRN